MRDVSIAIVNWNTRDYLDQCLASVHRIRPTAEFEIIVVDNASSDGSQDMVAEKYPDVTLLRNRLNLGFAAGCNIAFKHSSGRYFLLLNTDTIVLGRALDSMVEFMDKHEDAGAAGCRIVNPDGTLQRSCSRFPGLTTELYDALYLSKLFPRSRVFGCYAMSYWDFGSVQEVDFVGGSCLMVRREAIEEVGLLDEGYFMFTEEADWCLRMWDHGWRVYFFPDAQIVHYGGASTGRYGDEILLQLYISRNRFIRKHDGPSSAVIHRWIVALGALARLAVFSMQALRSPNAEARRRSARFQRTLLRWAAFEECERPSRLEPEVAR